MVIDSVSHSLLMLIAGGTASLVLAAGSACAAPRAQADLVEGHLALGFSYYYGDRDYDRALAEFEIAKRGLPNEAQAYMAIGAIQRRQGSTKDYADKPVAELLRC